MDGDQLADGGRVVPEGLVRNPGRQWPNGTGLAGFTHKRHIVLQNFNVKDLL